MPCYHPIQGWKSRFPNQKGKRPIVFKQNSYADLDSPVTLACGRCIGCRLEYSRQWAVRCVHEASLYDDNCFITLTYDNENLPEGGTLVKKHFQDFMKRLRKKKIMDKLKSAISIVVNMVTKIVDPITTRASLTLILKIGYIGLIVMALIWILLMNLAIYGLLALPLLET